MATHSSILAWRIPWTEEPDGLHRVAKVRHDRSDLAHIYGVTIYENDLKTRRKDFPQLKI